MSTPDPALADQVRALIGAMAPQPDPVLTDDQRLIHDLGFDSLRLMELTVTLERAFGLPRYRPEDLVAVQRVAEVIALISGSVADQAGGGAQQ